MIQNDHSQLINQTQHDKEDTQISIIAKLNQINPIDEVAKNLPESQIKDSLTTTRVMVAPTNPHQDMVNTGFEQDDWKRTQDVNKTSNFIEQVDLDIAALDIANEYQGKTIDNIVSDQPLHISTNFNKKRISVDEGNLRSSQKLQPNAKSNLVTNKLLQGENLKATQRTIQKTSFSISSHNSDVSPIAQRSLKHRQNEKGRKFI